MKLSEMNVDKVFDVVVDLTPHISNILENKEVKKLLKKVEVNGSEEEKLDVGFETTVKKVKPFINLIFKDSKEDIFAIVSIINDISIKEVKEMKLKQFMELLMETIADKELIELFTSRIGQVARK